jgi:hypothetical protein
MSCPLDFGAWGSYHKPFYDLWVARTMAGDLLYDAFSNHSDLKIFKEFNHLDSFPRKKMKIVRGMYIYLIIIF